MLVMGQLFRKSQNKFSARDVFRAWKHTAQSQRRIKRLERYVDVDAKRRFMQAMFDALRNCSHKRYVSKLQYEQHKFREELESKILV